MSLNWRDTEVDKRTVELSNAEHAGPSAQAHIDYFHSGWRASETKQPKANNPYHPQKHASAHQAWNAGHDVHQTHAKTAG